MQTTKEWLRCSLQDRKERRSAAGGEESTGGASTSKEGEEELDLELDCLLDEITELEMQGRRTQDVVNRVIEISPLPEKGHWT